MEAQQRNCVDNCTEEDQGADWLGTRSRSVERLLNGIIFIDDHPLRCAVEEKTICEGADGAINYQPRGFRGRTKKKRQQQQLRKLIFHSE